MDILGWWLLVSHADQICEVSNNILLREDELIRAHFGTTYYTIQGSLELKIPISTVSSYDVT